MVLDTAMMTTNNSDRCGTNYFFLSMFIFRLYHPFFLVLSWFLSRSADYLHYRFHLKHVCFKVNCSRQVWFSDRAFYVPILTHSTKYTKVWGFCQKRITIFEKVLTPFWKTFLWYKQLCNAKVFINYTTTIFHCSKKYGNTTRVTSLKVAPNIADAESETNSY